ncbi:MAG TPA: hypothetical protein VF103_06575 [Polyangiaceae bacterium]
MLIAAALCVVAVALGLGLGLVPAGRARLAGPLRTFALSAALTVVVLHLLPEAFSEIGVLALGLFAATSVVPAWLGFVRGLRGVHHDEAAVHGGLAAGYVGLLVHHVGDGLGLGAYASLPGGALAHADVMLALAAHTVPLVAVVAFAFQSDGGSRRALLAAAGLAGASVLGVFLSSVAPPALVERYSAWVAALVAGLLVHVVTHDLGRDLPVRLGGRVLDAVAAIAGVATSLLGGEHSAGNHPSAFLAVLGATLLTFSPPVLVGWVLVTLATRGNKGAFRRGLETAFGANLALDGLVLAAWTGGFVSGLLYAAGAFFVVRAVRAFLPDDPAPDEPGPNEAPSELPWLIRLDDVIGESVPWVAAALVVVALVQGSIPPHSLEILSLPAALGLAVLVALPVRVPPAAAWLMAAALGHAGLRYEAVLVVALLAPAPGAVELAGLARKRGNALAVRTALGLVVSALAAGALAAVVESFEDARPEPLFPTFTPRLALLVLVVLGARAAFERGLRGLLREVFPSHDTATHPEGHAHPQTAV